ncbi:MAG TPA: hypothetical protein VH374_21285, partial [Polyangia bacterium]|nr:hypothetical protein [Polyangia bacterium]
MSEWQLAVAQLGSTIAAEMNDHCLGRSSVALPHPIPAARARTAAPSETALVALRDDIVGDYAQSALPANV